MFRKWDIASDKGLFSDFIQMFIKKRKVEWSLSRDDIRSAIIEDEESIEKLLLTLGKWAAEHDNGTQWMQIQPTMARFMGNMDRSIAVT